MEKPLEIMELENNIDEIEQQKDVDNMIFAYVGATYNARLRAFKMIDRFLKEIENSMLNIVNQKEKIDDIKEAFKIFYSISNKNLQLLNSDWEDEKIAFEKAKNKHINTILEISKKKSKK